MTTIAYKDGIMAGIVNAWSRTKICKTDKKVFKIKSCETHNTAQYGWRRIHTAMSSSIGSKKGCLGAKPKFEDFEDFTALDK